MIDCHLYVHTASLIVLCLSSPTLQCLSSSQFLTPYLQFFHLTLRKCFEPHSDFPKLWVYGDFLVLTRVFPWLLRWGLSLYSVFSDGVITLFGDMWCLFAVAGECIQEGDSWACHSWAVCWKGLNTCMDCFNISLFSKKEPFFFLNPQSFCVKSKQVA